MITQTSPADTAISGTARGATAIAGAAAVEALRKARRRNRIANLDWFDAFYKAYVTALFGAIALYAAAGATGDQPIRGHTLAQVTHHGPQVLGFVVAMLTAIGLRSGGRGGPLTFEHAELRHVLLAPVDRATTVGGPAFRQLRHTMFIGATVGAGAGLIALRRLPHLPLAWICWGAVFGAGAVTLAYGAGMLTSGLQAPRWITDTIAAVIILWAVVDVVMARNTSPFAWIGHVGIWPLHLELTGIGGLVTAAVVAVLGYRASPKVSLEAVERRCRLVGQLRFAATLQDIRTVMVLQRQLSQEQLRVRPWISLRSPRRSKSGLGTSIFVRRCLHGLFRWSAFRLLRLPVLALTAGAAVCFAWQGTAPLFVVAGLILWVVALDLLEPLAQEVDHPDRLRSLALDAGTVRARHLIVPAILATALTVLAAIPALVLGPSKTVIPVLITAFVPIVACALGGAALVVIRTPSGPSANMTAPEIAGLQVLWRIAGPPGLAIVGMLPLLLARSAISKGHTIAQVVNTMTTPAFAVLALATWALLWVRYGEQFREYFTSMGARAMAGPDPCTQVTTSQPGTSKRDKMRQGEQSEQEI